MSEIIGKLVSGVIDLVVTVCLTVVAPMAVAWIGMQINKTRIGKKSMIDDEIFAALQMGVNNVGNKMAIGFKKAHADGVITDAEKDLMKSTAIKTARETLNPEADRIFKKYTPEKTQALIRYIVDLMNKE